MRWTETPKVGTKRIVKKFAWLPTRLKENGGAEWVWLEHFWLYQERVYRYRYIQEQPYWHTKAWSSEPPGLVELGEFEGVPGADEGITTTDDGKLTIVK